MRAGKEVCLHSRSLQKETIIHHDRNHVLQRRREKEQAAARKDGAMGFEGIKEQEKKIVRIH